MKTVEEVIEFLESEIERLTLEGTYQDDVSYLQYLIENIKVEK